MKTRFCYYLDHRIKHTERFPGFIENCLSLVFYVLHQGKDKSQLLCCCNKKITELPPIKYSNRVCPDYDLRVLAAACKHKVPANGVNLEEIIKNHKRNAANYKSSEYTSHGMLKFSTVVVNNSMPELFLVLVLNNTL